MNRAKKIIMMDTNSLNEGIQDKATIIIKRGLNALSSELSELYNSSNNNDQMNWIYRMFYDPIFDAFATGLKRISSTNEIDLKKIKERI